MGWKFPFAAAGLFTFAIGSRPVVVRPIQSAMQEVMVALLQTVKWQNKLITSTASAITQSVFFLTHGLNRPALNPTSHLHRMPRLRKLETLRPLSYVS